MLGTLIVSAILVVFAVIVRVKLKNFKEVPETGFQNAVEAMVDIFGNFAKGALGEKLEFLGSYFFGVFAFILVSNYSGLIGQAFFISGYMKPPTSDLATTLPLALTTFVLIHFFGIKYRKGAYFKEYLSPFFIFLPFNILGQFAKPISLAFRLFGNLLGGIIILEIMYNMLPVVVRFVLPDIAHGFFDVFVGALQAFVFTMLSMTFITVMSMTGDEPA
jgi:F-type H+-transporting ATPase subunit a